MNGLLKSQKRQMGCYKTFILMGVICLHHISCNKLADMIPPPIPKDSMGATLGYFVKENGTGDGSSWDNAMSPASFRERLDSFKSGESVYIAAGRYEVGTRPGEFLSIKKSINIYGGYDPESTGYDVSISYPNDFETIFTGDLNNNGKADVGDTRLLEISSPINARIEGITFQHGYVNSGTSRPGIHVKDGADVKLRYCKIHDNISDITTANDAGGAAIFIHGATVECYKTEIVRNKANNRGGAIRLSSNNPVLTQLILESCLVANNEVTADWGGAIQTSGTPISTYIFNSTIANNHVGRGAAINSGDALVLVNSTVVNNTATTKNQGTQIRCESFNKFKFINNIIASNETQDVNNPDIFINGAQYNIISAGNNKFGVIGGAGRTNFIANAKDQINVKASTLLGNNLLAPNDGYPSTIALINNLPGASLIEIEDFMKLNWPFNKFHDLEKDQRGKTRNTNQQSIGAYEF